MSVEETNDGTDMKDGLLDFAGKKAKEEKKVGRLCLLEMKHGLSLIRLG